MVNIVGAAPDVEALAPVAEALQARAPGLTSVVLNVNGKKASVAVGTEELLLAGRDHITERLDGLTFQVSANSFFQTNTWQAERLFEVVAEAAGLKGDETLMDLYSGTGAISLLLAGRCRHVYGSRCPRRPSPTPCATRPPTASRTARSSPVRCVTCFPRCSPRESGPRSWWPTRRGPGSIRRP